MSLQTIDRAVQLLPALGSADRMRLADLQRVLSLPRPTVHRLLKSLMQHDLVERTPDASRYRLGPAVPDLGHRAAPPIGLWRHACRPALRRLSAKGHPVSLVARIGFETMCIETLGGTPRTQGPLHVGLIVPLGAGSGGVAMLSEMEDEDVSYALGTMGPRIRRMADGLARDLPDEIHGVRRRGYGVVQDMLVRGMTGVSAVLHDDAGRPMGAFGLLLPTGDMDSESGRKLIDSLRHERDAAERELVLYKDTQWVASVAAPSPKRRAWHDC